MNTSRKSEIIRKAEEEIRREDFEAAVGVAKRIIRSKRGIKRWFPWRIRIVNINREIDLIEEIAKKVRFL